MNTINMKDFLNLKEEKNIVDIRASFEYEAGHIEGAVNNVENKLIQNHVYYLKKDKEYYIYCMYGKRSKAVGNYLRNLGYKVISIDGGYNNYLLSK